MKLLSIFRTPQPEREAMPSEDDRELLDRIRARMGHDAPITFGLPTRCPACGDYACVVRVDDVRGISSHRCPSCFSSWRLFRTAIEARPAGTDAGGAGVDAPVVLLPSVATHADLPGAARAGLCA